MIARQCVAAVISDGAADGMGPTRDDSSRCISTSRIVRSNCKHYHVSQQSSRVLKVVRGGWSYLSACRLLRLGLGEHCTLELRTQPIQMRHRLHRRRADQSLRLAGARSTAREPVDNVRLFFVRACSERIDSLVSEARSSSIFISYSRVIRRTFPPADSLGR